MPGIFSTIPHSVRSAMQLDKKYPIVGVSISKEEVKSLFTYDMEVQKENTSVSMLFYFDFIMNDCEHVFSLKYYFFTCQIGKNRNVRWYTQLSRLWANTLLHVTGGDANLCDPPTGTHTHTHSELAVLF